MPELQEMVSAGVPYWIASGVVLERALETSELSERTKAGLRHRAALAELQHEFNLKTEHRAENPDSLVYFIQSGEDGPIKVGTSLDPASRRDTLQTGNPRRLRILATIRGGYQREAKIHERFSPLHINGEWFKPDRELLDYIQRSVR